MNSLKAFWRILWGMGENVTTMSGYYVIQYMKAIDYKPRRFKHARR